LKAWPAFEITMPQVENRRVFVKNPIRGYFEFIWVSGAFLPE
jgi:hypothetical protein